MIPRVTHQVWVGSDPPDYLLDYRRTVLAAHPAWRHALWDDAAIDRLGLRNQALYDNAERITGHPHLAGQLRSDIARMEILLRFGGVYLDMDCEVRRPLDPLLDAECFLGWETDGMWANNAVMGAVAQHPFIEACVTLVADNVRGWRFPVRPNKATGPQFITRVLRSFPEVVVHPSGYFYPYLHSELHRDADAHDGAYVVHHWENARRRKGTPRARTP